MRVTVRLTDAEARYLDVVMQTDSRASSNLGHAWAARLADSIREKVINARASATAAPALVTDINTRRDA